MRRSKHVEQLDSSQLAFCQDPAPHLRLLAPAGCGKTTSLLFRCKHLSEQTKARQRFLIVTFTRAARDELRSRLIEDAGFSHLRESIEISTLNSWGFRRVKNASFNPKLITSKADFHFAVLNQLQPVWLNHDQVRAVISEKKSTAPRQLMELIDAFKSLGFDHVRHTNFEQFFERLGQLRDEGLEVTFASHVNDLVRLGVLSTKVIAANQIHGTSDREVYNAFFRFWREACARLIANATFTLEDQKYYAYLDEREKLESGQLLSGAARYDHVLVDEFQDINPLDLALIKAIAERNKATITVVGDDDQAIFEWRGASPEYILNPTRFLGVGFNTHTLEVNYRSPRNVVERSQRLIAHNQRRVAKRTRAHKAHDAVIEVVGTAGLTEEMECVRAEIESAIAQGASPSRIAIIGRKRSQLIPYQVYFASRDISFCAAEDLQVFLSETFDRLLRLLMIKERATIRQTRKEVVDSLLELCDLVKHFPLAKADRQALYQYLSTVAPSSLLQAVDALASYDGRLKGANSGRAMSLSMADAIRTYISADSVSDALLALAEEFDGLQYDLGKAEEDIFFTDPPFLHLAAYAASYGTDYGRFIDDIERAKAQLVYLPPFSDEDSMAPDELWKRPLHLMTALRAKGKEFDTVILLDVNDGIWPNKHAVSPAQLEAERRVFYVAFTRARLKVLLLFTARIGSTVALPSPYIGELGLDAD